MRHSTPSKDTFESMPTRIARRIQGIIELAKDQEVAVRTDSRTVVVGTIREVIFLKWRGRGKDRVAQFRIKLVSGPRDFERYFVVEKLPTYETGKRREIRSIGYHLHPKDEE